MISIEAKAVLLDMDGTLVESTHNVELIWTQWCRDNGIPPERVLAICHGVRSRDIIRQVAPHLDLERHIALLDELEISHFAGVSALPGAAGFLRDIGPLPWAVVTSASRRVALHKLAACGLRVPAILIGSQDVVLGKPDAEPYLLAARRLCIDPGDCLVFEDAPAGIASALAAGCRAVQVGGEQASYGAVEGIIQSWRQISVASLADGAIRLALSPPAG
ncbi:HAD-IA family hydrolase [Sodalis ligni]|uniref:HAD-IA family hydrolase n=1 Tax=Sodalis ligni TaxID=2697027 RepID=UPI00193F2331|nr:HAD-IA family hydrolase [Sodalis ligni]QWA12100.1 HAD-IA family hydrolase [Sodalis ligni]